MMMTIMTIMIIMLLINNNYNNYNYYTQNIIKRIHLKKTYLFILFCPRTKHLKTILNPHPLSGINRPKIPQSQPPFLFNFLEFLPIFTVIFIERRGVLFFPL